MVPSDIRDVAVQITRAHKAAEEDYGDVYVCNVYDCEAVCFAKNWSSDTMGEGMTPVANIHDSDLSIIDGCRDQTQAHYI